MEMPALRNGKQHVLQPDWAKSDEKFGRLKRTSASALVASDRGVTELSVISNWAGFISRGFKQNMCPTNFNLA